MKRLLRVSLGIVLMVLLLGLFLWRSDPKQVMALLRGVDLRWLAAGLFANFVALVCRAARWQTLLDPDDPPPFRATFFATAVGFMLSTVLPVRAADVARPALLSRKSRFRFSSALGSVLTERVLDLLTILSLFVFFAFSSEARFTADPVTAPRFIAVKSAAWVALAIVALLGTFVVSLYFSSRAVRRLHIWLGGKLPARIREGWLRFFDAFVESLGIAHRPAALVRVILLTLSIWLCLCSQFSFVLLALGRSLPFSASFFVTGLTIVGLMIPTPGGVGGFHKACQIALTNFYQFDIDSSVVVALLFHFVGIAPVIVTGTILFLKEGLSLRQFSALDKSPEGDK